MWIQRQIIWNPVRRTKHKKKKSEWRNLRDLCDTIKTINTHIIRVPEGIGKEKGAENFFKELMTENFPNPGRELNIQIREAQRISNRLNIK